MAQRERLAGPAMSASATSAPVALVTGSSRGIGRGIAVELARAGFDLVLNYASNEAAAEEARGVVAGASPRKDVHVAPFRADVADASARAALLDFARGTFGRLDALVNNAGVAPKARVDLLEASEESFDRLVTINLKGPYFLTQLAARWMIEQRASGGDAYRPVIVNVTSVSAYAASPERGDYCVVKAGLAMATQLYASRLADHGIGVFEVRPGVIATDMTSVVKEKYDALIAGGLTPIKRWGTPEDCGRAVAAIATGAFPFSTGEVINVDGGFHMRRL